MVADAQIAVAAAVEVLVEVQQGAPGESGALVEPVIAEAAVESE